MGRYRPSASPPRLRALPDALEAVGVGGADVSHGGVDDAEEPDEADRADDGGFAQDPVGAQLVGGDAEAKRSLRSNLRFSPYHNIPRPTASTIRPASATSQAPAGLDMMPAVVCCCCSALEEGAPTTTLPAVQASTA
jgi:hypothetical protein